jgi:single-stranded DNA-binding protein
MSNCKVTGTIHLINETKEFGTNGFRKREVVLVQNQGKYDNYIPVTFILDQCEDADELTAGAEVTIEYRLNGRKWTSPEGEDKYFVNLEVMNVVNIAMEHAVESAQEEKEDIPF